MTKYVCTACSATFSGAESAPTPKCRECGSNATRRRTAEQEPGDVDALPEDAEEIGSGDALTEEVRGPAAGPTARERRGPTRGNRRTGGGPAVTKSSSRPVAAYVALGITLLGASVTIIATRGGSKDSTGDAKTASESSSATPNPPLPGNPAEELKLRRSKLAAGDLAGRKALIAFAKEHELNDARLALLREVLLLDSEDADARKALGFTKHTTTGSLYAGRWLTKTDAELADAYDKMSGKGGE